MSRLVNKLLQLAFLVILMMVSCALLLRMYGSFEQ